jgi:hypothetical protein
VLAADTLYTFVENPETGAKVGEGPELFCASAVGKNSRPTQTANNGIAIFDEKFVCSDSKTIATYVTWEREEVYTCPLRQISKQLTAPFLLIFNVGTRRIK